MTRQLATAVATALIVLASSPLAARQAATSPDVTGKWHASFDTQIGVQTYTYELVVKNGVLTGKISSTNGESELQNGKVEAGVVSFTEILTFMEMKIAIVYTGKIASADEIKFTRVVGEFATEELVAKRVK